MADGILPSPGLAPDPMGMSHTSNRSLPVSRAAWEWPPAVVFIIAAKPRHIKSRQRFYQVINA